MKAHFSNMTDEAATWWPDRGAAGIGPQSLLVEISIEDLPRWERAAAAIKGLLELMAESTARMDRKMQQADWDGLFCEAVEGAAEKAKS